MPTEYAQGIDVSRWQQIIDWRAVKADGITFAFCKATDGLTWVDPMFARNWQEMRNAGILRGAYHFFQPNQNPNRQAEHFAATLQRAGAGDLPPVLDIETLKGVSNQTLIAGAETFLNVVEQSTGHAPIIYTRASFWDAYLRDQAGRYPPWTVRHPLWVAHYTSRPEPILCKGWDTWHFWQYTSTGRVNGVNGNCDRNRFNGNFTDLLNWLQPTTPVEEPPPTHEEPVVTEPAPTPVIPEMLPAGTIGRWPGDREGYGETLYEITSARPFCTALDAYHKPLRYKPTSHVQDVAISYYPQLPGAGRYAIEAFIPGDYGETRKADYHILYREHGQGAERRVRLDQSQFPNQWALLGEFFLDPALQGDGRVNVTDFSDERPARLIAFAGIRWRRVG